MISEVVLHIGMEKTGSSSIQSSFQSYDDGDLIYAPFEWANHSLPIQVMFKARDQQSPGLRAQGLSEAQFADLRQRATAQLEAAFRQDRKRMVISSEGALSLSEEQHHNLRAFLTARCEKLRVLAYVRDPLSYGPSSFQQGLKTGETRFWLPVQNFRKRIGRVYSVYGADSVELARFDPQSFPNNSVVMDFAARVGARPDLLQEQRANDSMAMFAAAALFLWNREGIASAGTPEKFKARIQLIRHLLVNSQKRKNPLALWARKGKNESEMNKRGVRKFQFSQTLVHERIQTGDIRWMEQKLGSSLLPPLLPGVQSDADYGVKSEDDFLAIGEAAYAWLAPVLRQYQLTPTSNTTVAALDSLYAFLLNRIAETPEKSGAVI